MLLEHPRMQQLLGMRSVFKFVAHMWKFGKNSSKPTILLSDKPWINEVERYRTVVHKPRAVQKLVKLKRTRTRVKWTGDKKALKSSQEYTKDFGRAIMMLGADHAGEMLSALQGQREALQPRVGDQAWRDLIETLMCAPFFYGGWGDADLSSAFRHVMPSDW